jgi:iron(III) transport system ATP-binding protein
VSTIRLTGVSRAFGPVLAVDGVDLDVADGERLAVVGPSGSGKTTLVRLIAGLETPDAGVIEIDGRVVARDGATLVPTHRRRIGYVPQDGALFPHLSVAGNVGFVLPRGGDRRARVRELLEVVALDPAMAERRPHELSGGQQQRVALARAMGVEPEILLLDEPFSTLDAATRVEARDAMARIVRASGTTAIIVTHDRDDAIAFADRTATMADGRCLWLGPSLDVAASMREGWCPTCGRPFQHDAAPTGDLAASEDGEGRGTPRPCRPSAAAPGIGRAARR